MIAVDPRTLGKYELRSVLGRSTATVYEGWDPAIARKVAIKTVNLPPEGEAQDELARFRREAQAAGRLSHPNIVAAYDYGETASVAYIVMEFVEGRTLKSMLEEQERLALPDILRVMDDVLAALQYSHDRGVVHRDMKPANVIVTAQGHAKVADFGIARIESSDLTQAGIVMGTPAYMSPEQFMGQVVDRRTDIYACGVLLYQLLTGKRPFEGGFTAVMHKALNTVPPPPSDLAVTAPRALDAVVARAMAKRPEDRYGSAAELARAIRGGAATAPTAVDDATFVSAVRTAPTPARAKFAGLPALGAAGLAVALGAAAWLLLAQERKAEQEAGLQPPPPALPTPRAPAPAAENRPPPPPSTSHDPAERPAPPPVPDPAPIRPAAPNQRPPPPSPPPRPPLPDPADALRAAVAAALDAIPCALLGGDLSEPGEIRLGGLARKDTEPAIRAAVARAAPSQRIAWAVAPFEDARLCPVLDVLRPVAGRFGAPNGLLVGTADGRTFYREGERVVMPVEMPPFAALLRVDYVSNTGAVEPLHPAQDARAPQLLPAAARVRVGDEAEGFVRLDVGPPYGTDLVLVLASAAPLFNGPRPPGEAAAAYLRDLRAALDAARRDGNRVAAAALVLETAPAAGMPRR